MVEPDELIEKKYKSTEKPSASPIPAAKEKQPKMDNLVEKSDSDVDINRAAQDARQPSYSQEDLKEQAENK